MESAPAWVANLPTINAALNATSALLLLLGYRFIRARRIDRHRACMVAACTTSSLFLVGYLTLHYHIGGTLFGHEGEWVRTLYFAPHPAGTCRRGDGRADAAAGPQGQVRVAQAPRALDATDVALRVGHRRHHLRDALSRAGGGGLS